MKKSFNFLFSFAVIGIMSLGVFSFANNTESYQNTNSELVDKTEIISNEEESIDEAEGSWAIAWSSGHAGLAAWDSSTK